MTERCKSNPCCGDYRNCKKPLQFISGESYEEYESRNMNVDLDNTIHDYETAAAKLIAEKVALLEKIAELEGALDRQREITARIIDDLQLSSEAGILRPALAAAHHWLTEEAANPGETRPDDILRVVTVALEEASGLSWRRPPQH